MPFFKVWSIYVSYTVHSGLKKPIIFNFILGTAEQVLSRRCEDEVLHINLNEVFSNGYFVSFKIYISALSWWREMLSVFRFPHWQCNHWIITAWLSTVLSNTTCTFLHILAQAQEPMFAFCFHNKVIQNLRNSQSLHVPVPAVEQLCLTLSCFTSTNDPFCLWMTPPTPAPSYTVSYIRPDAILYKLRQKYLFCC